MTFDWLRAELPGFYVQTRANTYTGQHLWAYVNLSVEERRKGGLELLNNKLLLDKIAKDWTNQHLIGTPADPWRSVWTPNRIRRYEGPGCAAHAERCERPVEPVPPVPPSIPVFTQLSLSGHLGVLYLPALLGGPEQVSAFRETAGGVSRRGGLAAPAAAEQTTWRSRLRSTWGSTTVN